MYVVKALTCHTRITNGPKLLGLWIKIQWTRSYFYLRQLILSQCKLFSAPLPFDFSHTPSRCVNDCPNRNYSLPRRVAEMETKNGHFCWLQYGVPNTRVEWHNFDLNKFYQQISGHLDLLSVSKIPKKHCLFWHLRLIEIHVQFYLPLLISDQF
jgi:hypothetical protein